MRSLNILFVTAALSTFGFGQAETSSTPEMLLIRAYGALASVPPGRRIDDLVELTSAANKARSPLTNEWIAEVDRLSDSDNDACRKLSYRARMTTLVSAANPKEALQRIQIGSSECKDYPSMYLSPVLRNALTQCDDCTFAIAATVEHLARNGTYPYQSVSEILRPLSQRDASLGQKLFSGAVSSYQLQEKPTWRMHRQFLNLVEAGQKVVPPENVTDALKIALRRVAEPHEDTDQGTQQLMLTAKSGPQQYTEQNNVIFQLYTLASQADSNLANRVKEKWPFVVQSRRDESDLIGGIAIGPGASVPRDAQQRLEISQAQNTYHDTSLQQLQKLTTSPLVKVAVFSTRASTECKKSAGSGLDFLDAADSQLRLIEDDNDFVMATEYFTQAAAPCNNFALALSHLSPALSRGARVIREEEKTAKAPVPIARNSTYLQLRRIISNMGKDWQSVVPVLDKLQDDELRALLLAALAEASVKPKMSSLLPNERPSAHV